MPLEMLGNDKECGKLNISIFLFIPLLISYLLNSEKHLPQKDEITKAIDRYVSIIGNYPFFVNYFRQVNSIRKTIDMYQPFIQNKEIGNSEDFFEYLKITLEYLEQIEINLAKKLKSKSYKVPVFNFNADLILKHCTAIQNSKHQLTYLQLILQYYKPYLELRYKEFEIVMNEVDDEFILNYLLLQKQVFNNLLKEKSKKDIPFLVHLETFEEKIQHEISVITLIDNSENDKSTLEAINNPPGTPIKKKSNEEINKNKKDSDLEYITSNELMKILGVGRTTIYNYMKSGKLKAKKVGRKNLFRVTEVKNMIENG